MRLAFSNLAWEKKQDSELAELFTKHALGGVEIAPSKIWDSPLDSTASQRTQYRDFWMKRKLPVVALQSVLYGKSHLHLFGNETNRSEMFDYLRGVIRLCSDLGASVIVFGSPKNRKRGDLDEDKAFGIATEFFRALGTEAEKEGVTVCIEPNASVYGCDFVRTSVQGAELVKEVGSAGFGLHLDWGCMELQGEDVVRRLSELRPAVKHFHISSNQLKPTTDRKRHQVREIVQALSGGPAFCSVEMLNPTHSISIIEEILEEISECFEARQAACPRPKGRSGEA